MFNVVEADQCLLFQFLLDNMTSNQRGYEEAWIQCHVVVNSCPGPPGENLPVRGAWSDITKLGNDHRVYILITHFPSIFHPKDIPTEEKDAVVDQGFYTDKADQWRRRYRKLLEKADIECPPPDEKQRKSKRGRLKRSKARNLLERLRDFEQDVLRFMEVESIPFTNNQGENDLRMTKVQQKISGCFRSMEGAKIFCRVRS
jgi:hypothetical protein